MEDLYGVFTPVPKNQRDPWRWGLSWDAHTAAKAAIECGGTLRVIRGQDPKTLPAWDAPTFWACSEPVNLVCQATDVGLC